MESFEHFCFFEINCKRSSKLSKLYEAYTYVILCFSTADSDSVKSHLRHSQIQFSAYIQFNSRDLTKLEDGLGEKVVMFAHFMVAFIGSIILALVRGWQLALVCMASLPVTFIVVGVVAMVLI